MEVLPWKDQKYKIIWDLKPVLQAPNLTLISCSGLQHLVSQLGIILKNGDILSIGRHCHRV